MRGMWRSVWCVCACTARCQVWKRMQPKGIDKIVSAAALERGHRVLGLRFRPLVRVCTVRIFGCECWSVLRLAFLPQSFRACWRPAAGLLPLLSVFVLCTVSRLAFSCLLACCHCSLYLFCHFCVAPCLLACTAMV